MTKDLIKLQQNQRRMTVEIPFTLSLYLFVYFSFYSVSLSTLLPPLLFSISLLLALS